MADWHGSRSKLLAAASAATAASTDIIEAARAATGSNFTRPNQVEIIAALLDAVRLTLEASSHQGDEILLVTLDGWIADHV